ncbi:GNAT family N-acetyltransferase [Rhodococcus sp. X156]|uniref:GNAT family N-acetyltransferase n=1 Tax=Rhodococcus sp. X156 TaxID=2499145 RepID=UPI0013E39710|nr:GNAT family N-acetyltransferase [Rhodococcus sp. X156]
MSTPNDNPVPTVRVLPETLHRAAAEVFGGAYLIGPVTDQMWERSLPMYRASLVQGIVEDDGVVGGVARSWEVELDVPGGRVPAAAVSSVGVRADRRRRGYLRALMQAQLQTTRDNGALVAVLRATEASIYSRFGYGVASTYATLKVTRRRAVLRPGAAAERRLKMITPEAAVRELPAVYERIRTARPGTVSRPSWWWAGMVDRHLHKDRPVWVLCTVDDDDQVDGFLLYTVNNRDGWDDPQQAVVEVLDLRAVDERVELALWQAAFGIDLSEHLLAHGRPLDPVLDLALVDPRAAVTTDVEDETWLRLLDVPAALSARSYGAGEPVVIGVDDQLMPDNSGRYRVSTDGVQRTDAEAELHCEVGELAAVYLGGTSFTQLAAAGRVRGSSEVLARADALFGTPRLPWSGTYY